MSGQIKQEEKMPSNRVINLMPGLKTLVFASDSMPLKEFLEDSLSSYYAQIKVQASSPSPDTLVYNHDRGNGFIQAFLTAYAKHLPLELSPDDIWLTVCQGFCQHIVQNAQELRKEFVDFEGKKELKVVNNEFQLGNPHNDWSQVFGYFSEKTKEIMGSKMHSLFVQHFSTTTPLQTLIYEGTLLSAMQKYFDYTFETMCGIPKVRMRGMIEDWKKLREDVAQLQKYGLEWWINKLLPIIDKFVAAVEDGECDPDFWNSVGKIVAPQMSGMCPAINGWIANFFPYINSKRNTKMRDLKQILAQMDKFNVKDMEEGFFFYDDGTQLSEEEKKKRQELHRKAKIAHIIFKSYPTFEFLPVGVTEAPFTWNYFDKTLNMCFITGFIGVEQTEDGFVKPQLGWAVGEKIVNEKAEEQAQYGADDEDESEEEEDEIQQE